MHLDAVALPQYAANYVRRANIQNQRDRSAISDNTPNYGFFTAQYWDITRSPGINSLLGSKGLSMWTSKDLVSETDWTRTYATADRKCYFDKSKFLDGEVSVTLEMLAPRWSNWSEVEKLDFCNSFSAAPPPNAEGIVRLVASDQSLVIRSSIANSVADHLPTDEAVALLVAWLAVDAPGNLANYLQALSRTHHPRAHVVLEQYYLQLLDHPSLMDDAKWTNHVACDLMWCIEHLLAIGTSPSKVVRGYQVLLTHPCKTNRKQVDNWLTPLFGSN